MAWGDLFEFQRHRGIGYLSERQKATMLVAPLLQAVVHLHDEKVRCLSAVWSASQSPSAVCCANSTLTATPAGRIAAAHGAHDCNGHAARLATADAGTFVKDRCLDAARQSHV